MTIQFNRPLSHILEGGQSLLIDDALASRMLSECVYDGQRPLNDDRALLLADAMEHGSFLGNTQIAFGAIDGRYYLVNGQHRLTAITLSRQPQHFRIEVYPCRSMSEVASLYCRFDQPGGQRSLTQVSRSLGLHDDDAAGLRPATAALLLRATPLLMIDLRRIPPIQRPRATRDLDRKKEVALQWKPWAIDYQRCLEHGITTRTGRFRTGGVFAVALVTLRYQNAIAMQFWIEAIRNSGLMIGDPRQALHSHFLSSKRASTDFALAEAAANAWSAFYQKRNLTVCKALGNPLRILGTPFVGGE